MAVQTLLFQGEQLPHHKNQLRYSDFASSRKYYASYKAHIMKNVNFIRRNKYPAAKETQKKQFRTNNGFAFSLSGRYHKQELTGLSYM